MKTRICILAAVFAISTWAQTTPRTDGTPAFSESSLKGSFVLSEEGFLQTTPFSALASLQFDGAGKVTGTETIQSLGVSYSGAAQGAYTVNADGTGTLSLTLTTSDDSATVLTTSYKLEIASGDTVAVRADNGVIATTDLLSGVSGNSSSANLKGGFVLRSQGFSGNAPYALVGGVNLDGVANLSGTGNFQSIGVNTPVTIGGTYMINADGTGTFALTLTQADVDGTVISTTNLNLGVVLAAGPVRTGARGLRTDVGVSALTSLSAR